MKIRARSASVAVLATAALALAAPSPAAAAFGQETFGCRFSPGPVVPFTPLCTNITGAPTYNLGFSLGNLSGSYTFAWTVTGEYTSVISGCTATSTSCGVRVSSSTDKQIVAEVTLTQDGQVATRRSVATVNMACGSMLC